MPDEFLSNMADLGAEGRGWRSGWAIFGLLAGAAVGGYLGYVGGGVAAALAGVGTGALIGWGAAVLLRGLVMFLGIFIIALIAVLCWYWLTGRL